MCRLYQFFAPLILCAAMVSSANATLIVDTGTPADPGTNGPGIAWIQSLAGQFSTAQTWSINSVEGWLRNLGGAGATGTVSIYTDSGSLPDIALFSAAFTSSTELDAWQGAYGVNWLLPAGTYWAVFEVLPGQTLDGAMPGPVGAPLPFAYSLSLNDYQWLPGDDSIGIRIEASDVVVPAPATLCLLGLGLLALAGMRCSADSSRNVRSNLGCTRIYAQA